MKEKRCLECGNNLQGKKRKFCSKVCSYTHMNKTRKKNGYYKNYYKDPLNLKRLCKSVRKCCVQSKFNLTLEEYEQLTNKCSVCNWKWGINLHHKDCNKYNNARDNLVPLCPNHHMLLHTYNNIKFEDLGDYNER